jgi:hypothetical protein
MRCIHMHLFALTYTHIHPKIIISVAFRFFLCLVLVYCSTLVLFQVYGAYGAVWTITSTSGAPFWDVYLSTPSLRAARLCLRPARLDMETPDAPGPVPLAFWAIYSDFFGGSRVQPSRPDTREEDLTLAWCLPSRISRDIATRRPPARADCWFWVFLVLLTMNSFFYPLFLLFATMCE